MKTRFIAIFIITGMLVACSSTPDRSPGQQTKAPSREYRYENTAEKPLSPLPGETRPTPTLDSGFNPATAQSSDIPMWLEQATSAPLDIAIELRLRAAEVLLRDGEAGQADDAASELVLPELEPDQAVRLAIVRARVLRSYGKFADALSLLADPLLDNYIGRSPVRRQLQFHQMRATLYAIEGNNLAAAKEWISIDPMLAPGQLSGNREAIWQSLMQVPNAVLRDEIPLAQDRNLLGWLELANIAKDNQSNLEAQITQRDSWITRWRGHPANSETALPGGLSNLDELIVDRPEQVAVLLPVTGKLAVFGKAIRDGFIAAYYEAKNKGAAVPTIHLYDSAEKDITTLYQQALQDGNDMVIGPLSKENLSALASQASGLMALPTLALNRIDGNHFPSGLYQFGLNPEDEAEQIAEITKNKGYQHAMILSPQGSWGSKVAEAFSQKWQQLGGKVVTSTTFDSSTNNYSKQIKGVLQVNESEQRRSNVQQIIGMPVEFEPRRRSDVDFIFLVARSSEARAVKPLLAYHYAGDLPVYATSHIYRGVDDPTRDQDINDIRFIDIPWVFNKDSKIRKTIDSDIPNSSTMLRMYALGVDSFRLHLRLGQLRQGSDASVFGETGTLRLNELGQIERQLVLAQIRQGHAEISVVSKEEDDTALSDDTTATETTGQGPREL